MCWSVGSRQFLVAFQEGEQSFSGARNSALYRADGAVADLCRFFIGKAAGTYENEGFALFGRQSSQRTRHVGQFRRPRLPSIIACDPLGSVSVPRRLAPGPPAFGVELVAKNREQPRLHISSGFEGLTRLPGLDERFLRKVIGALRPAGKRSGKGAQERNERQQFVLERLGVKVRPARRRVRVAR